MSKEAEILALQTAEDTGIWNSIFNRVSGAINWLTESIGLTKSFRDAAKPAAEEQGPIARVKLDTSAPMDAPNNGVVATLSRDIVGRSNAVELMQANLASLGWDMERGHTFKDNGIDGVYGSVTEEVVKDYQRQNDLRVTGIADAETQNLINQQVLDIGLELASEEDLSIHDNSIISSITNKFSNAMQQLRDIAGIERESQYALHSGIQKELNSGNERIAGYMDVITEVAEANGLDPVLYANQIYRESDRFSQDVVEGDRFSPAGAIGIGQIMPATAAAHGYTVEDIKDWRTNLELSGKIMGEETLKYGDQRLALAPYNGGARAVEFVKEQLGLDEITFEQWEEFNKARQLARPGSSPSAWHNETLKYTQAIVIEADKAPTMVASNTPAPNTPGLG